MFLTHRNIFDWDLDFDRKWWWSRVFDIIEDSDVGDKKISSTKMEKYDDRVVLQILVPGFKKEELTVEIDESVLKVRGQSKTKDKAYFKTFFNSWRLSEFHDVDGITSKLEDGILYITVPYTKGVEKDSKKVIPIK